MFILNLCLRMMLNCMEKEEEESFLFFSFSKQKKRYM